MVTNCDYIGKSLFSKSLGLGGKWKAGGGPPSLLTRFADEL